MLWKQLMVNTKVAFFGASPTTDMGVSLATKPLLPNF